jgi:hypothetical protein
VKGEQKDSNQKDSEQKEVSRGSEQYMLVSWRQVSRRYEQEKDGYWSAENRLTCYPSTE